MNFKKYSSIENSFDEEFVGKVREQVSPEQVYVVQEKVHGANTSFICDGTSIQFAKRTAVIEDGETFYGYEEIVTCARRARGTTCSAQMGTARSGQIGTGVARNRIPPRACNFIIKNFIILPLLNRR